MKCGGKVWPVDLSDVTALEDLRLETDILVNNAGVQHVSAITEFPPERFRFIQALMVEAPFLLIRAALPHMYEQSFGRIINISSCTAFAPPSSRWPTSPPSTGSRGCRR